MLYLGSIKFYFSHIDLNKVDVKRQVFECGIDKRVFDTNEVNNIQICLMKTHNFHYMAIASCDFSTLVK